MTLSKACWWAVLPVLMFSSLLHLYGQNARSENRPAVAQIIVPDEDRFTPFAITVRVGQPVVWINNDADDHTVVSDDATTSIWPPTASITAGPQPRYGTCSASVFVWNL